MKFGICNLSIVSIRLEPSDQSELVTQVLFGEHFKVLEQRKKWSRIRIAFDNYEGWMSNNQFEFISEELYEKIEHSDKYLTGELIDFITDSENHLTPIPLGASLPFYNQKAISLNDNEYTYEGDIVKGQLDKSLIIQTSFLYLNAPYLWGGKTPFGIDCSGFTQMVYKLCGYKLLRDASQQATQGEVLSFIEESEPGDLAFFDNAEGNIVHVGIIMRDNYIIHAHGKVRIDRLDHSGIYNVEQRTHTHKLRVIKKII